MPAALDRLALVLPGQRYNPNVLWPDGKRARYAAIRNRMAGGYEGSRMRRIKGARHAHAVMRASGRVPGEEARAARKANAARGEEKAEQAKLEAAVGSSWRVGNVFNNI